MGCDTSKDNIETAALTDEMMLSYHVASASKQHWPATHESLSMIQKYIDSDIKCGKLEVSCPGPRLATCEAWLDFLNMQRDNLIKQNQNNYDKQQESGNNYSSHSSSTTSTNKLAKNDDRNKDEYLSRYMENNLPYVSLDRRKKKQNQNVQQQEFQKSPSSSFPYTSTINGIKMKTKTPTQDFINMALNLGVLNDLHKASEHEEYFAQLSEKALHSITIRYYTEIMEHTNKRLKILREKYMELSSLYKKLDRILAVLNGGTYLSRFEENLDKQLRSERDVRDKLGSIVEQWHICGLLLKTSSQLASQSLKQWRKIKTIINPRMKLETVLNSRKDLQASIICLECAQAALPNVAIKNISNRQISTIKHCIIYVITDIANMKRYEHCSIVFTNYELNSSKAVVWFYDTFNKTLREDFLRANDDVFSLMKTLRDYREEIYITQQYQQQKPNI